MVDKKVMSNGNVKVIWVPSNGIADYTAPTLSELNAGIDLTEAIAWDEFELAASESNEVDDRSLADLGNAVTRGFQQFSAATNFFYPANRNDTTSPYVVAWNTFKEPRVYGYLVMRVLQGGAAGALAAGDFVSVYKFVTDAVGADTEGEDSYKLTVTYLPQGEIKVNTLVADGSGSITATPSTLSPTAGDVATIEAELYGKDITQGAKWTSNDTTIATVSPNGVVTAVATGSADITISHPSASTDGSVTVTVA